MKTIIVNQGRNPELFRVLHLAWSSDTKYQDCYITRYYEYTTAGQMIGTFTLRKPD